MKPPTRSGLDPTFVTAIIRANPGQTILELAQANGLFMHELERALYDSRAVELRDGKLFPRVRKPKSEPVVPSRWARLMTAWRG
jgi:hypothetical protein